MFGPLSPLSAIGCLLFVCFFLSCFRVSIARYTITLERQDPRPPSHTHRNLCLLTCRNNNDLYSDENYSFAVNDTVSGVQNVHLRRTDSLLFTVTKETEGMYFCWSVGQNTLSNRVSIVVLPTQDPLLEPVSVRVWSGTTAVLNPLVQPGNWHSRYRIDWIKTALDAMVEITYGLRMDRYSVDEKNFSLIIESVSRSDAGDFLGVLKVYARRSFYYEQTKNSPISLVVSDPPSIIQGPLDQVISHGMHSSINFTCTARGYPLHTITWYRNTIEVSLASAEYQEYSESIDNDTVMSTLTKSNLIPQDSGTFACNATVQPGGNNSPMSKTSMADLSVLEISDVRIDVTKTGSVTFTIYLAARVSANFQVAIFFRDSSSGATLNHLSPERYSNINQLTYTLPNAPYSAYTANVAVFHGAVQSRLFGPLSPFESPVQYSASILTTAVLLTATLIAVIMIITFATIFYCTKMVRHRLRDMPVPIYEGVDLCHTTLLLPEQNRTMIHPVDSAHHDSSVLGLGIPSAFEMTNFAMDNREDPNHTYDLPEEDMEHDQDTSSGYDNIDTIVLRCCNDSTHDLYQEDDYPAVHEQNHDSSVLELGIPSAFEMTNVAIDNQEGPNHTCDLPEEDMEYEQVPGGNIDTIVLRGRNDSTRNLSQEDDHPDVHEQISE